MLALARVESGASTGPTPTSDLNHCVCTTVTQLETFATVRQVSVAVHDLSAACIVPLSSDDCSLIVSNLLMNAIQHSPPHTQIDVRLGTSEGSAQFTVEDHGEGIDPATLPRVFERFYRGDPSRARATGGAGLGLAICKAAVEKAGGAITLASEPGRGTTATVRLPVTTR